MAVIIRLQNLPWNATSADVRQTFRGLTIPDGGVHIVGGDKGDVFIAFGSDDDARQAMLLNNTFIKGVPVQLFLSSRNEMQEVIARARTKVIGGPEFVPKNDSYQTLSQNHASNYSNSADLRTGTSLPFSTESSLTSQPMRDVPQVSRQYAEQSFNRIPATDNRFVEYSSNDNHWSDGINHSFESQPNYNRRSGNSGLRRGMVDPTSRFRSTRGRDFGPNRKEAIRALKTIGVDVPKRNAVVNRAFPKLSTQFVELDKVPLTARRRDILNFFGRNLRIARPGVGFLRTKDGHRTGAVAVKFVNEVFGTKSLSLSGNTLLGTVVHVRPCSSARFDFALENGGYQEDIKINKSPVSNTRASNITLKKSTESNTRASNITLNKSTESNTTRVPQQEPKAAPKTDAPVTNCVLVSGLPSNFSKADANRIVSSGMKGYVHRSYFLELDEDDKCLGLAMFEFTDSDCAKLAINKKSFSPYKAELITKTKYYDIREKHEKTLVQLKLASKINLSTMKPSSQPLKRTLTSVKMTANGLSPSKKSNVATNKTAAEEVDILAEPENNIELCPIDLDEDVIVLDFDDSEEP